MRARKLWLLVFLFTGLVIGYSDASLAGTVPDTGAEGDPTRLEQPGSQDPGIPSSLSGQSDKLLLAARGKVESFAQLRNRYIDFVFRSRPTWATQYGVHDYDSEVIGLSAAQHRQRIKDLVKFQNELQSLDFDRLSRQERIDWLLVLANVKARLLELGEIEGWRTNPDFYASIVNGEIFCLIQRDFAPREKRLESVISRQSKIPEQLKHARKNLVAKRVPRIFTEITLEKMPGIIGFFEKTLPEYFACVQDEDKQKRFKSVNSKCVKALREYQEFLKKELLPNCAGSFALGGDLYSKKLFYEELVDEPLDKLLARGKRELNRLKREFATTAASIDRAKTPAEVFVDVASVHPKPDKLISSVSGVLEEIRSYCVDKNLVTIPGEERARVAESPPFLRALTFASMDTPGPFEKKAKEAYYYVTLPEKSWKAKRVEEHMRSFSDQDLLNTSIHEAYPGHYTQFLWVNSAPSKARKIFGCGSNAEGWAHYCERMMVDEGFRNRDPRLRLAQLHDALLRVCRYIVGISMHTKGMTLEQGIEFFVKEGCQERANAVREAKRGTMDPTYLVYTMGKLDILSLKEEMRTKLGDSFSLKKFHDQFLAQGFPPISIVRAEMLQLPVKNYFSRDKHDRISVRQSIK